ncbi:InlB B-repeat-containing protein, partial [Klebsiella pneumoniae]|uniref:InlB B-repeat-containing protein n=1 Tax=Klebsiella pneumoniae TaxID=573 RepID=UPI001110AF35
MRRDLVVAVTAALTLLAATFVAVPSAQAAVPSFTSDDFSGGDLGGAPWTVVDPVGDGTVAVAGAGTDDAQLGLSIPAGTDHDAWGANRSLRVMQPAADVDLEVEARWSTVPTRKYQMQGILIEQDDDDWLRFDVHSTGSALRLFASRTAGGSSKALHQSTITAGEDVRLRVTRAGSSWTLAHASGTQPWTVAATVTHTLAVTAIGPFAGTSGTKPEWTSSLDWFFDTTSPVDPEDGQVATLHPLTTEVVGQGTVTRAPDAASYVAGTDVQLTAEPAAGWEFSGWSGDASGTEPTTTVTVSSPASVVATFTELPEPPPVEEHPVQVQVVGDGTVTSSPQGSTHPEGTVLTLTATPGAGSEFTGWSGDATGTAPVVEVVVDGPLTVTATFEVVEEPPTEDPPGEDPPPSGIVSDDFSAGVLGDQWTVVDPKGDGTVGFAGTGTTDARLALTVPAGSAHDPWGSSNGALRVMQPAADEDVQIAARFTSAPTLKYQMQGLLVQQDAQNWMRFDVHSTGSSLRAYVARTAGGVSKQLLARTIPNAPETGLRVTRTGDEWRVELSQDGVTWEELGSVTHALDVTAVGPFAGNSGTKPAFTAEVDWFFDTATPVDPEDAVVADVHALSTAVEGEGAVSRSPSAGTYVEGTVVELTAAPAPGWEFTQWGGDASGTSPTTSVTMDAPRSVTATFTRLPANPPVIDVWYGDEQAFGVNGESQLWVNVLGNVSDTDGVTSLTASVNGGTPRPLQLGPNLRRLYGAGDFNVQIPYADLQDGANTVLLRATDALGEVTTEEVVVVKDVRPVPGSRTVTWQEGDDPNDSAQVVDGKWSVGPDGLTVEEMGYDRTVAI